MLVKKGPSTVSSSVERAPSQTPALTVPLLDVTVTVTVVVVVTEGMPSVQLYPSRRNRRGADTLQCAECCTY